MSQRIKHNTFNGVKLYFFVEIKRYNFVQTSERNSDNDNHAIKKN